MKKILIAAVLILMGTTMMAQEADCKKFDIAASYSFELRPHVEENLWIYNLDCRRLIGKSFSLGIGAGFGTIAKGTTTAWYSQSVAQGYVSCLKTFDVDSRWKPNFSLRLGAHYIIDNQLIAMAHTGLGVEYKVNYHNGVLFELSSTITSKRSYVGLTMGFRF